MRIRRVLGTIFLLLPLLLGVAHVIFRRQWMELGLVEGWEWIRESPAGYGLAVLAVLVTGAALLFPDARRSPIAALLLALPVVGLPLLLWSAIVLASFFVSHDRRVVRFPDPGRFEAAVAVARGARELAGDVYVRHRPGGPMEPWRDLGYLRCTWPFEVHRSPHRPRYLFVDSEGRAVTVVDLGEDPSEEMEVRALQEEFGVRLAGLSEPSPLKVMSFNIRYDNPGDGENRWDARKDLVVETIRKFDPDLLGLQEVLDHQGRFLRESLEGYAFVGVGRDDGAKKGEFAPVLYRKRRFEILDSGHFWLSETPEVPGSVGWDASLPRIATWARLRDRERGRTLVFLNTHWDHRGEEARLESAKLVRRFLDEAKDAVVVAGDFNTPGLSSPYNLLHEAFRDPFRGTQFQPKREAGTYHGFRGKATGPRIDWILCSRNFGLRSGSIDRTSWNDRYPSDHFPVTAAITWD